MAAFKPKIDIDVLKLPINKLSRLRRLPKRYRYRPPAHSAFLRTSLRTKRFVFCFQGTGRTWTKCLGSTREGHQNSSYALKSGSVPLRYIASQ